MSITYKIWTAPSTGETRIYLQGVYGQRGAKVWIEKQTPDAFGSDWTVRASADYGADLRAVKNEAADRAEAKFGRRSTFAAICSSLS